MQINLPKKTMKNFLKTLKEGAASQKGFSLVEILVALTLLGIAGTFVATKIFDQLKQGQVQSAGIQINALKANLKEFRRTCGFFPSSEDGLNALVEPPTSRTCTNYPSGGFLEDGVVPLDPWDYSYEYTSDGNAFEIISSGPDGEIGTEDDISSKKQQKQGKTRGQ